MSEPAIILFKGRGFISQMIRWQTRSRFSHAALRMRDGRIVEAWQGKGVRITELTDYADVEVFRVPSMSDEQWDKAIAFACAEVGKGYDYWGVIRFVSRRLLPTTERWFCSELVFAAIRAAGVNLLQNVHPEQVAPGAIALSPYVQP
jgi:uncharacterized protein YycO